VTAEAAQGEAGEKRGSRRRRLIGRITSDKMDKTVTVEVVRFKLDAVYKKYVRVRKRYKAHDETNEFKTGDRVEIIEHKPLSKHKRWKVIRLINRPAEVS
jgi:small subunit ribosomal protein S17